MLTTEQAGKGDEMVRLITTIETASPAIPFDFAFPQTIIA